MEVYLHTLILLGMSPGDDDLSSSSEEGEKAKPAKTKV